MTSKQIYLTLLSALILASLKASTGTSRKCEGATIKDCQKFYNVTTFPNPLQQENQV